MDNDDYSIAYIKLTNGSDILGLVPRPVINKIDDGKSTIRHYTTLDLLYPYAIMLDYNEAIDPTNLFLEDYIPATDVKLIQVPTNNIIDIMPPSKHAVKIYAEIIKGISSNLINKKKPNLKIIH